MVDEGTIHGTGLEGSLDPGAEASLALMQHRGALAAGNWREVDRTLDLHTWGSGDPGILHREAAEHGVETAVRRLAPFWARASAAIADVRLVDEETVEIYERVEPPRGRALSTVSLVRRRGGRWRVVQTASTSDEILRLCVFGPPRSKPDALPHDLLQWAGELRVSHTRGVLVQPETGFELQIEAIDGFDARVDATVPEVEARLADGCAVLMLVGEMPSDPGDRQRMMTWASHSAAECARRLGSNAVLLPSCDRVMSAEELEALATTDVFAGWIGVYDDGEFAFSRGLAHAGVPELELLLEDWESARGSIEAAIEWALCGELSLEPDSVTDLGGTEVYVQLGRRGPIASTTYGRWGSRLIRPVG